MKKIQKFQLSTPTVSLSLLAGNFFTKAYIIMPIIMDVQVVESPHAVSDSSSVKIEAIIKEFLENREIVAEYDCFDIC